MAKERKPGFVYLSSDVLKQEIAVNKKTGWLYCEDGVRYSPQELCVFKKAGVEIDIFIHAVKKAIGGEVVKIERNMGRNSAEKPDESGCGIDTADGENPGGKVPGADGAGPQNRDRELDIF